MLTPKTSVAACTTVHTGFNNIRFHEGDEAKAAFKTNMGLFEPTVMPFRLHNTPVVFQRMMNTQFANITAMGKVIIYMDDILIATEDDIKKHRKLVHKVLECLAKLDRYLKLSKCQFKVRKIEFLGVVLKGGTVTMDPIKVSGVQDWKVPKTVQDIHAFLGFCNFYRCFIRGFSQIAKPLNNLLKKGTKWLWGMEEIGAFEKLKNQICEEPVLLQPDQKKPFKVEVNASNYACGTVLMQCDDKNTLHLVVFFSKTMNEAQCNYDVYNRKLLALVEMFRHWRHYLHQAVNKVKVYTDHTNLLFWKIPRDHNRRVARVARWHMELMEYDFKLVHISGKKNSQANTLSWRLDYDQDDNDNKNLVVLPPKFFQKIYTKMITDKKEERTPLSNNKMKLPEGGADPLIKKHRRKAMKAKKEERTPSDQKASKSSIRVIVMDGIFLCLELKSLSLDVIRWHVIMG